MHQKDCGFVGARSDFNRPLHFRFQHEHERKLVFEEERGYATVVDRSLASYSIQGDPDDIGSRAEEIVVLMMPVGVDGHSAARRHAGEELVWVAGMEFGASEKLRPGHLLRRFREEPLRRELRVVRLRGENEGVGKIRQLCQGK